MSRSIWLLSAYRSQSHAAWADWLTETFSEFNWHKLELPGRHFRWRIRGNPLSWLNQLPADQPDLILASSMVDLATLRGLHPRLAHIPSLYYFHENQFDYPRSQQQHDSVDPQMVQLYGALAADLLLFNSAWNRNSFIQGVQNLLNRLPDQVPAGIAEQLNHKSRILPVAIQPVATRAGKNPALILWNHRWEYDKAPEVFAKALLLLEQKKIDFQLALLGERSLKPPAALLQIEEKLAHRITINGHLSKQHYRQYLSQSAIVVSTAIHEFQGLSIMEAVSGGAVPLVPDALCYTEQFAELYRYPWQQSEALANKLYEFLKHLPPAPDISGWYSENLQSPWRDCLLNT